MLFSSVLDVVDVEAATAGGRCSPLIALGFFDFRGDLGSACLCAVSRHAVSTSASDCKSLSSSKSSLTILLIIFSSISPTTRRSVQCSTMLLSCKGGSKTSAESIGHQSLSFRWFTRQVSRSVRRRVFSSSGSFCAPFIGSNEVDPAEVAVEWVAADDADTLEALEEGREGTNSGCTKSDAKAVSLGSSLPKRGSNTLRSAGLHIQQHRPGGGVRSRSSTVQVSS